MPELILHKKCAFASFKISYIYGGDLPDVVKRFKFPNSDFIDDS